MGPRKLWREIQFDAFPINLWAQISYGGRMRLNWMKYVEKPGRFFQKIWFWMDFGTRDIFVTFDVFWCILDAFTGLWSQFEPHHYIPRTSIGLCATFYKSIRSGQGPIDQRILRSLLCTTGRWRQRRRLIQKFLHQTQWKSNGCA